MWVFKSSGIILKIHKSRDAKLLYTIFSKKYSKTEKTLDIWYVVNFEIITQTKSDIHSIKNIKILSEFQSSEKWFKQINSYLELIASIKDKTALWVENLQIFSIIPNLHTIQESEDFYTKTLLSNLKLQSLCWELQLENKDPTVAKILKFIYSSDHQKILKLSWINDEILKKLEQLR